MSVHNKDIKYLVDVAGIPAHKVQVAPTVDKVRHPFWSMPTLHFPHFLRESGHHLHPRNPWWSRQKTDVPHCHFWYILSWLFFNLFLSILAPWFCPLGLFWFVAVINSLIVHMLLWHPLKNYRRSSSSYVCLQDGIIMQRNSFMVILLWH